MKTIMGHKFYSRNCIIIELSQMKEIVREMLDDKTIVFKRFGMGHSTEWEFESSENGNGISRVDLMGRLDDELGERVLEIMYNEKMQWFMVLL